LQRASCAETAQEEQARQRDQGEMAEGNTPTLGASHQIEHQLDAERTNETPGIAAHAVQAHGGAAQFLVSRLHRAGGQGRTVKVDRRVPQHDEPSG
jgi:hypothetical protein